MVIGYSVAAVLAFFFAEWFIHLPLFNFVSRCTCSFFQTNQLMWSRNLHNLPVLTGCSVMSQLLGFPLQLLGLLIAPYLAVRYLAVRCSPC